MTDSNKVAPKLAPMPATHMSHQVEGLRPLRHGKQPTRTADKKLEWTIPLYYECAGKLYRQHRAAGDVRSLDGDVRNERHLPAHRLRGRGCVLR